MVKIKPEGEEETKNHFSVSRLLLSRSMFTELKQKLSNKYGKATQKTIGTTAYLALKSLIEREELEGFEFSESAIREVAKAIEQSPSEGRSSIEIEDTILTQEIIDRVSEGEEGEETPSVEGFVESLDIRQDIKEELKSEFESVEELREADLESINGIGEATAIEIKREIESE